MRGRTGRLNELAVEDDARKVSYGYSLHLYCLHITQTAQNNSYCTARQFVAQLGNNCIRMSTAQYQSALAWVVISYQDQYAFAILYLHIIMVDTQKFLYHYAKDFHVSNI